MKSKSTIFLTGTTGFLGSYLLKVLLENGHHVFALARGKKDKSTEDRVLELQEFWDENFEKAKCKNLEVVEGDITIPDLGIDKKVRQKLESEAEIIFHSAALAELKVPLEVIREVNVQGTRRIFDFALRCKRLKKINHISTAYVVGDKQGIEFSEDMLNIGQGFYNSYEQSKFEAECVAKEYQKQELNVSIFRPSMVMGHSQTGKTTNFRLIYEPLHFFAQELFKEFPANLACWQNLINIDTVVEALYLLGDRDELATYHIVSPNNTTIKVFLDLASEYFDFTPPRCMPVEKFDFNQWTPVQKALAEPFIPYFNYTSQFLDTSTKAILSRNDFECKKIANENFQKAFSFCCLTGFLKQKRGAS